MDTVIACLLHFQYLAMFAILVLCGLGLPLPEEVTLIGSGLMVGWGEAEFLWASVACVSGILVGDSVIFGFGHHYGKRFLSSRPMHVLLPLHRQLKVAGFFAKHGSKALFLARFFPGVRIGVYAYAGSQRVSWWRFLTLDLLGALLSGPTSIFIGAWAARAVAEDRDEAVRIATEQVHRFGLTLLMAALAAIALVVVLQIVIRRRRRGAGSAATPKVSMPTGEHLRG